MNRTHRIMLKALAFAGILLLAALGGVALATATPLTPLRGRTSDEAIARDLGRIEALWLRIAPGGSVDLWRGVRARQLLIAASTEYIDNDRTGFADAAYAEAESLANQLQFPLTEVTHRTVPAGRILTGSTRVRPDLWDALETLKRSDGFECARAPLAYAEVELLWAGNEQVDQGDCRTSTHLAAASRMLDEARVRAIACRPLPPEPQRPVAIVPPKPLPVTPSAPVAPVPAAPTREELRIPRNVHFALDQYILSTVSKDVIAGVARVLAKYPSISVRLEGHTDSRASVAYNLRLSRNRVNAVQAQLRALGVAAARMTTTFKGKSDLKVAEDSKANFARNRRVEMVFVDSEGRDIQAEDQEQDLQIEGSQRATPRAAPAVPAHRSHRRRR